MYLQTILVTQKFKLFFLLKKQMILTNSHERLKLKFYQINKKAEIIMP